MPLGTEIGLGPGITVVDGDPAPSENWGLLYVPPKRAARTVAPNFRPMHCDQTAGWIKMPLGTEVGLGPGIIVVDGDPDPSENWGLLYVPPKRAAHTAAPNFRPMSIVTKQLDGSRCHLVRRQASAEATLC